jgi:hypothetical protein
MATLLHAGKSPLGARDAALLRDAGKVKYVRIGLASIAAFVAHATPVHTWSTCRPPAEKFFK